MLHACVSVTHRTSRACRVRKGYCRGTEKRAPLRQALAEYRTISLHYETEMTWVENDSFSIQPITDRLNDNELTDKIIHYYTKATDYDNNWHKVYCSS